MTGCGVVVGLQLAVSRTKVLQEVDIYRSVASVQQDRPQFVVNLVSVSSTLLNFIQGKQQVEYVDRRVLIYKCIDSHK